MREQVYTTSPPPAYSDIHDSGPCMQPPPYTDALDQPPTYSSTELSSLEATDPNIQQPAVTVQPPYDPNPAYKQVQNNPQSFGVIHCCEFFASLCECCSAFACCLCLIVAECNN